MAPAILVVVSALLAGVLPPPPKQAVLTGRGSFGEIHFDHEAHLGRRIACAVCHGAGPVRKPALSPSWGHETCRACHVEQKRGPTSCRECHQTVKDAGAATMAAAPGAAAASKTAAASPTATAAAPTPQASPPAGAGGEGAPGAAAPPPPSPAWAAPDRPDLTLRRGLRAGIAMMTGSDRSGAGLGVDVTLEQGRWVAESVVDWSSRPGAERTLVLFGLGAGVPLGPLARARTVALCGVDAGSPAYVLPAVGLRAGVELRAPRRSGLFPSADLSVAYVNAIGKRIDASGQATHDSTFVFSVLLGWQLPAP